MAELIVVDLFAGLGGFSEGARMGGGIIWAWWEVAEAPRIYERLRRGGYVRFDEHGLYAQITLAGAALLKRTDETTLNARPARRCEGDERDGREEKERES